MAKRTTVLLGIVIVAVIGLLAWQRYKTYSHYNNGDITSQDLHDGTVTGDAPSTPSRSDSKEPARPQSSPNAGTASTIAPSTDSVPANPTNGAVFAGTGRFQVYRQGNLTWRVNTDTGSTCILFATDEEWRKSVVYDHGCGNS